MHDLVSVVKYEVEETEFRLLSVCKEGKQALFPAK
jgi:hypothetical protein